MDMIGVIVQKNCTNIVYHGKGVNLPIKDNQDSFISIATEVDHLFLLSAYEKIALSIISTIHKNWR